MRHLRFSLFAIALVAGCGGAESGEAPQDDDDDDSFSTTFPPVTTTGEMTSAGTDASGGTSGVTSDSADATGGDPTGGTDDPGSGSTGDTGSDPLSQYDDEFDDPTSLEGWNLKSEVEGAPDDHTLLDVGQSEAGKLSVIPAAGGWFDAYTGFFLYRELDGDFLVETHVNAGRLIGQGLPPTRPYNSAGLLIRDPNHAMDENWVTHNVGYQELSVATEGKSTVNSTSMLDLVDGPHVGRLRICKLGSRIVLTRKLEGEMQFTQTHDYDRTDMPGTLQVGLVVGGWNSTGNDPDLQVTPDIEARFDYIRFRSITSEADCLQP